MLGYERAGRGAACTGEEKYSRGADEGTSPLSGPRPPRGSARQAPEQLEHRAPEHRVVGERRQLRDSDQRSVAPPGRVGAEAHQAGLQEAADEVREPALSVERILDPRAPLAGAQARMPADGTS